MHELDLAKDIARDAGRALSQLTVTSSRDKSSTTDIATNADLASEQLIVERLSAEFPEDGIVSEESGEVVSVNGRRWIIDPLDGTSNYKRGLWPSAVSIALEVDNALSLGVVYDFLHDDLYSAARGGGVWCNDERLPIASARPLRESFVALTGTNRAGEIEMRVAVMQRLVHACDSVRDIGSSAMQLCLVARGVFDASVTMNVNIWDVAAGFVIAHEAGCSVVGIDAGNVVAPAELLAELLPFMN